MEEKLIEEEVARRVEQLVSKRVEEELEKRKEEIEAEVERRIEVAKRIMEKELLEEMERKRQAELEAQRIKEVKCDIRRKPSCCPPIDWLQGCGVSESVGALDDDVSLLAGSYMKLSRILVCSSL